VDPSFGDRTIPPYRPPPPPPQDLIEGSPPAASDVEQQIVDGVLAAAVHDNSQAAADSFSSAPFVDGVERAEAGLDLASRSFCTARRGWTWTSARRLL